MNCEGGFYIENFVLDRNIRQVIENVALYENDYTKFFVIYRADGKAIGEIFDSNPLIIFRAYYASELLIAGNQARVLSTFCDYLFGKCDRSFVEFHENITNLNVTECKKLGFLMDSERHYMKSGQYYLLKKDFYLEMSKQENSRLFQNFRSRSSSQIANLSEEKNPLKDSNSPPDILCFSFLEKILRKFRVSVKN